MPYRLLASKQLAKPFGVLTHIVLVDRGHEFVTWYTSDPKNGPYHWGNYFSDLEAARSDFNSRGE